MAKFRLLAELQACKRQALPTHRCTSLKHNAVTHQATGPLASVSSSPASPTICTKGAPGNRQSSGLQATCVVFWEGGVPRPTTQQRLEPLQGFLESQTIPFDELSTPAFRMAKEDPEDRERGAALVTEHEAALGHAPVAVVLLWTIRLKCRSQCGLAPLGTGRFSGPSDLEDACVSKWVALEGWWAGTA